MQVIWAKQDSGKEIVQGEAMDRGALTGYFREELFEPNLKAKNKKEAFAELANMFVKTKVVRSKQILLEMLDKRETLGSTGIGKGVAIPHGRTTGAIDVTIAFARSGKGIDFDSVDKKPVHLIFAVLAPPIDENNRYLPVLGKLVEVLSETKIRNRMKKVETFEDLMSLFEGED